jgi:hypothetical protein
MITEEVIINQLIINMMKEMIKDKENKDHHINNKKDIIIIIIQKKLK